MRIASEISTIERPALSKQIVMQDGTEYSFVSTLFTGLQFIAQKHNATCMQEMMTLRDEGLARGQPLRLPGTSVRPPKQSHIFAYSLQKREQDRRACCRDRPAESNCAEAP